MAEYGHQGPTKPNIRTRDEIVKSGWHYSFGWLRRPELDDKDMNLWAYEEPNGDLRMSSDPRHERAAYLDLWESPRGEQYFAFSYVPRTKA